MLHDGDLAAAARHFERALALEPTNPSILGNAGVLAQMLGRSEEAIALEEYLTTRDPVDDRGAFNLGRYYLSAQRLDEAVASSRTAWTLTPGALFFQYYIGQALLLKGEPEAALAAMQQEPFPADQVVKISKASPTN